MKRKGNIYEKIYDIDNIKKAIHKASKGKRKQNRVKKIMENKEHYAAKISEMLRMETYSPSPYIVKKIYDGANKKERTISKPKFYPDQIIHWAIMLQIEPIMMKGMYHYNCGSVPGRGTARGQKATEKWIRTDVKNTKYCLKMDIRKFYPSINNATMKEKLQKKIKDEKCLRLLGKIIDSAKGMPIGNYTSQWFANFYLQDLDHFIKEKLKAIYYIRYVDDLVIFGPNKRKLHKMRVAIEKFLKNERLELKGNWQVFKVNSRAVDFLGLKFYREKTTLRRKTALRIRRRLKKIAKKKRATQKDAHAVISYWGWIRHSDSYRFYIKYVKPYLSIKEAKKVVKENGNQASTGTGI